MWFGFMLLKNEICSYMLNVITCIKIYFFPIDVKE